jgi:protein-tyrosine phosphatase
LSKRAGISYFPIRTVDEDSVRTWVKKLGRGVKVIEEASRNNGKVYLHCTYGRGRSPTMAMAFLVWKGWPVQGAISHVTRGASKVWDRGNPVTKYQKILEAYAGISGRSRARPAG